MDQLAELIFKMKNQELENNAPETDEQMRARVTRLQEAERRYSEAEDILKDYLRQMAQKTAELETVQMKLGMEQEKLKWLSQRSMDSQVPTTAAPSMNTQLPGMERPAAPVASTYTWVDFPPKPQTIQPRQTIRIQVANTPPDAPIVGEYVVEPSGKVALGPMYGRVELGGMTIEKAEEAIKKHLAGMFQDPQVQVTMPPGQPFAASADVQAGRPATTFATGPDEVSVLRKAVDQLQQENLKLKKQIEQSSPR
jgi:hypothetical protein